MKLKLSFAVFILVVLSPVSFAAISAPSMPPNQFWGTVTINGAPAPDGTSITATINGVSAGSSSTSGGSYELIVENPRDQSDTVLFFVSGVQAASDIFSTGKSTELNLAVTIATPPSAPQSPGGGGGGGGSTTTVVKTNNNTQNTQNTQSVSSTSGPCRERWTCSEWSKCDAGVQKRTCTDANKCGTIDDLPMTSQPCAQDKVVADSSKLQIFGTSGAEPGITGKVLSMASANGARIAGAVILIGGGVAYYLSRKSKPGARKK